MSTRRVLSCVSVLAIVAAAALAQQQVTGTSGTPPAAAPAPITPDSRDVANEFHLVQDRLTAAEQLQEERHRNLSEKIADVRALIFGLAGFMTLLALAAPVLQSKLAERVAERQIDHSLTLVEKQIDTKAESVLNQIADRYRDPKVLEEQITGHIIALLAPHKLCRELDLELLQELVDAKVITREIATRIGRKLGQEEVKHV